MGVISKGKAVRNNDVLRAEFNKVAHTVSTEILRNVDGSNPAEVQLIKSAKLLGDLANSNAMRQLTASCLLATCREVVAALDMSNEGERQLYLEAQSLVEQFETARDLCA